MAAAATVVAMGEGTVAEGTEVEAMAAVVVVALAGTPWRIWAPVCTLSVTGIA